MNPLSQREKQLNTQLVSQPTERLAVGRVSKGDNKTVFNTKPYRQHLIAIQQIPQRMTHQNITGFELVFNEVHRKRLETTKDLHISIGKLHLKVPASLGAGYK